MFDQVDYDRVGGWFFSNLPNGEYVVVLEAEDHADHVVQDKLTILVTSEVTPTDSEGSSGGGGSSGDTGSDTETSGPTGSGSNSSGEVDKSDGCGCRSSDQGAVGALGLPLLGLWLANRARRRRRA